MSAVVLILLFYTLAFAKSTAALEPLVIAASSSLKHVFTPLGKAFEEKRPDVRVQLHYGSGLELRQMIAATENRNGTQYFIGSGPIHLVAPGDDEFITRLEYRSYVLPRSRTPYATESLVLVVPESLVDAPSSFEEAARDVHMRIAVADPKMSVLGQQTSELLNALRTMNGWEGRLDVATDARGVLDHLLNGQADAGIVFGPDAARQANRVRMVARAPENLRVPIVHSMAMEHHCANRSLCEEFLTFIRSEKAQSVIQALGYGLPTQER